MHVFALFLFLTLGAMAVSLIAERLLDGLEDLRAFLLVDLEMNLVWAVGYPTQTA